MAKKGEKKFEKDALVAGTILVGDDKKPVRLEDNFEIEIRKRDKKYFLGNAHSHNYYEMYYLVSGEIKYFIGDSIYIVKKGDVVLIPPHVIHKTVPGEDYEHTRILMTIMPDYLEEFLKYDPNLFDFFGSYIIPSTHRTTGRIENILQSLITEYVEGYDKIMVKSLLGELFTILKRNADETTKLKEDMQVKRDSCSNRILGVVRYINKKYQTDIGLENLAQRFFMSPTYLSRTFKRIMGTTYSDYIRSVRINYSIHLLLNTDANITEIAALAGFNSSNHFCKTFKDCMGISPLKYRQGLKVENKLFKNPEIKKQSKSSEKKVNKDVWNGYWPQFLYLI